MPAYRDADISVGTWIELTNTVPMRYEVSHSDATAALYFGPHDNHVLVVGRENLARMLSVATDALAELNRDDALTTG
jgi:hypothetical protein